MASFAEADRPLLLIIGGPNGSGKSSAYSDAVTDIADRTIWIVNPDLLTARIRDHEGLSQSDANIAAVQRVEAWLDASLAVHKSVGVETVLSTPKYRRLVERAKRFGFEIGLIYVLLETPALNVERVKLRVIKGGHDVPEDAIRRRFDRSLAQLPWFLDAADWAIIYDNSGERPLRVGVKQQGLVDIAGTAPRVLLDALSSSPSL